MQPIDYEKLLKTFITTEVKIKKLNPDAIIPSYAKPGDAGMDMVATEVYIEDGSLVCKTGLAMEIPEGHVGLLFPRSSISKYDLSLSNSVGVIDSQYRGEIMFKFKYLHLDTFNPVRQYKKGDRVGQIIIMPYPKIEFNEVQELSESERGNGGFGSTGR